MSGSYLANQFLIAMPGMADPNFSQTVTYVSEHSERGALGIVINRALDNDARRSSRCCTDTGGRSTS